MVGELHLRALIVIEGVAVPDTRRDTMSERRRGRFGHTIANRDGTLRGQNVYGPNRAHATKPAMAAIITFMARPG